MAEDLELEEKEPLTIDIELKDGVPDADVVEERPAADPVDQSSDSELAPIRSKTNGKSKAVDNLRATLIFFLVLQSAVLETVADTPKYSEEDLPKQSVSLLLFMGVTRTTVVGLLYFISGAASHSLMHHSRSPLTFALTKTWKTTLFVIFSHGAAKVIQHLYGPWPEQAANGTSYYALQSGKTSLLQGPIFYVLLLLTFDYTYAFAEAINLWLKLYTRKATSKRTYLIWVFITVVSLELWTALVLAGGIQPPTFITPYLPLLNLPPHFPIQYIIAYFTGIRFTTIYKFIILEPRPRLSLPGFVIRLSFAFSTLYALYRHFPTEMHQLLSLADAPTFKLSAVENSVWPFVNRDSRYSVSFCYAAWSGYFFTILAPSIVQLFFVKPLLKKPWGLVSRAAYSQPFIHMFFVIGIIRKTAWIDNLICRCLFVGIGSALLGWSVAMLPLMLYQAGCRLSEKLRGQAALVDEEKLENRPL